MRPAKIILFICVIFLTACHKSADISGGSKSDLRVLGYMYSDYNWFNEMAGIDLSKLTDLNLAFMNPDSTGTFPSNNNFLDIVQLAHQQHVRIFISIGGGDPPSYLAGLVSAPNRPHFIAGLLSLMSTYNFDGVDVDLEGDLIGSDYASFIDELSNGLKSSGKLMSAALATWNANLISDHTLNKFDFINIMSYDNTGPWDPSNPGPHSPVSMARDDFNYFNKTRNIASEKLLIGVPFYGYIFRGNFAEGITYREIVNQYSGAENKDEVDATGGGRIYYNGIPTIKEKVSFALANKAGGIMIWELHQDTNDGKSLLKTIYDNK